MGRVGPPQPLPSLAPPPSQPSTRRGDNIELRSPITLRPIRFRIPYLLYQENTAPYPHILASSFSKVPHRPAASGGRVHPSYQANRVRTHIFELFFPISHFQNGGGENTFAINFLIPSVFRCTAFPNLGMPFDLLLIIDFCFFLMVSEF